MPPDSSTPPYKVQCLFIDKAHEIVSGTGFKPWVVEVAAEELAEASRVPVSRLLQLAEEQHRGSSCPDCPGRLLIKCGWSVSWPVASAGQALRDTELEHNLPEGIRLMVPHAPLSDYLQPVQAQGVIRVLFECTFDRSIQGTRRMLEDEDETTADKQLKPGAISQPTGLRVLRSSEESTNPISLLPRSCSIYPDYTAFTERVFVDKTRFIPIIDELLCAANRAGCILTLPKGTGKSTFLRMLIEWYNCLKNNRQRTFEALKIGQMLIARKADKRHEYYWGMGTSLCLSFDLSKIGNLERSGSAVSLSIVNYVRKTFQEFVDNYQNEFTSRIIFPSSAQGDVYITMLTDIANALKYKRGLLIIVDSWDGPLQSSIGQLNHDALANIADTLNKFLTDLFEFSRRYKRAQVRTLVVGNLPPILPDRAKNVVLNISTHPNLDGAFGISDRELQDLFTVLSWHRPRHMHLGTGESNLACKLGRFEPAPYSPNTGKEPSNHPSPVYNFTLVLHHVSVILRLNNGHEQPLESPLLRRISKMGAKLLQHSNIRRDLPVLVPEFHSLDRTSLGETLKFEEPLWKLLFYVGDLKVTNWPGKGPDPMWSLMLTSEFAKTELFKTYPPIRFNKEPPHDIQLRALLERNTRPMMDEIAKRIFYNKTLADLYQMSEAVLQTIFDAYFDDDGGKYRGKYFPQVGLLTNPAKSDKETGRRSGPSHVQSGLGRFGYADMFLAGFRNLHPGRAVVIELKMVSLWNLFLGIYENERTCSEKVNGKPGDPPGTFRTNCLTMIKRVDEARMDELREMTYGYRNGGKLDSRTIGALLQETEIQLRSYLNAIVNGRANNWKGEKGITNAERRVKVENNPRAPDEVIGLIVCCIGRRIITILVEPQVQNDKYQYLEQDGWRRTWQG